MNDAKHVFLHGSRSALHNNNNKKKKPENEVKVHQREEKTEFWNVRLSKFRCYYLQYMHVDQQRDNFHILN